MLLAKLIKKLLNVNNIVIEGARFEWEGKNECLVIGVRPYKGEQHHCPICGKKSKRYDNGRGVEAAESAGFRTDDSLP